jgi:hypothetical protein
LRKTTISRAISCSLGAALLTLVSCGKKGDPLPPLRLVPATAEDVSLRQVGARLLLTWKAPARNEDGSTERVDLATVRVMRRVVAIPPPPPEVPATEEESPEEAEPVAPAAPVAAPPPFRAEATVIQELEAKTPGENGVHEDTIDPAWIGMRVEYALMFENRKGRASSLSEIVRIDPVEALAPPRALEAEAGDGFVALRFLAPAGAPPSLAFSVSRKRGEAKEYPAARLNPEPLTALSFEDRGAPFGEPICYVVSALLPSSSIESLPSEEVCLTPEDRFAPGAPEGLVAVPTADAILLSWRHVDASDRRGYRVYRGGSPEGPFQFLAEVTESSYRDETAGQGETLFYYVTTLDDAPAVNESERSEVVETRRSAEEML